MIIQRTIYIQCAKLLRDKYEEKLITLLEMGDINNYEYSKEFIDKMMP